MISVWKQLYKICRLISFAAALLLYTGNFLHAQAPVNDDCNNALAINIPNEGFGLGNFTPSQTDLTNATVQPGENFAPAIFVAALDKKSVWYKFSIPTIRAVRVTLNQPGTTITAGDAGFAVYKDNSCLPGIDSISTKLTPIVTFGNTYHPCVPAGDYLIQVSSKLAANGPITISLEISDQTGAAYDHPNQAYAFGTASPYARKIDFESECHSIEDSAEVCHSLFKYNDYYKSAWFTFTTPAYFDYLVVSLSGIGTSYFPGGGANIFKKFGYTLYKGDVVTAGYKTLPVIDGCDTMLTNGRTAATKQYHCSDLETNTTYSIQLFIHKDCAEILRLGILTGGTAATAAPLPVTGMPASNVLGVLPASGGGTTTTLYDYFGCNSKHSNSNCSPAVPAAGIRIGASNYNLSSFATFTLQQAVAITFRPGMVNCGPRPVIRLFKQDITSNCADMDMSKLVGTAAYNQEIECLTPGNYVVQVLGLDTPIALTSYSYDNPTENNDQCLFTNLGSRFRLDMIVYTRQAYNKYSLNKTGAFDSINRVGAVQLPLASGITYQSSRDTIGCQPTLQPWDTTCSPANDKIVYRQFLIADSGTVAFDDMIYSNNPPVRYRLYKGDANALAAAQNVFNFPDKVSGIVPHSLCMNGDEYCENKSACVTPGTYTFTTMASVGDVGRVDRPSFTFIKTRTKYNSLANALNMGSIMDTLGPNGGTRRGTRDYWSCDDNAVPINGYSPCPLSGRPATKAIYRQFYLKEDAIVRISNPGYGGWCVGQANGTRTLFYGKGTDGQNGLSPVGGQWNCFTTASTTNNCSPLPAGWYTIVSWGTGPNYDSTMRLTETGGRYNGYVSYFDEFDITITPACPGPKYNRPYKASVNNSNGQPHLIQLVNRFNSTPAYPRTDTTYTLPTEYFNCTLDTPFSNHPITACEPTSNRVVYYVFRTTEECFLQVNTGGYFATIFDKDVRTDSLQFVTATPVQQCLSRLGMIQFCFFQPGTYTLVIFAKDANICRSVTPTIYVDKIGYSRFDYANKAYDFGVVPPDNTFHNGKVGDVNPLHSLRAPSNDFFYCTTGAFATDPTQPACDVQVNPNVYKSGPNKPLHDAAFPANTNTARRNLWYTFVANDPGTVRVKVENKTTGRSLQPKFAVYRSNVDGTLPFNTVVTNGEVDSTIAQGLNYLVTNLISNPYHCYNTGNTVSFYRDPCTSIPTRYYVLVENVNGYPAETGGQFPNTQVEVSVLIDSVNLVLPKFDHYSQAGDLGTVGAGTFTGPADNYSCASRDATDPVYNTYGSCQKTLWYKFTSTITGNVRYRIRINNVIDYAYDEVQLLKEVITGDSTTNGLKIQFYNAASSPTGNWAQTCVSPGTYYLLLTGCNRVNQYVTPEIELIEATGDFCSRPVPAVLPGPGAVTASVLVNCHTIGTDYGEFGPQLTCPPNATTNQYKSSWFRMDIGGTDTLDVTTYLEENTNAASGDIKYRLMTGDCGAMQEQSCVLDALTQNTYQCLVPGQSYYVQVFTPLLKNNAPVTGTIDLKLAAVPHVDTCAPLANCLVSANFNTLFDCTKDDSVKFVNFSTYGSSISYQWDFGYNGQTSTAVSPAFFYPALPTDQSYTVKLVVTNNSCSQKDSVARTILVPGRPYINLGTDIAQCNSADPIILKATSHPGATYLWQNNTTADTFKVTATGNNNYWVRVNYNGCSRRDTIKVLISPIRAKPLQQINLCTDSVLVDVRRGNGETYRWNTGATTRSVYMSEPGYYWVDITYFNCVYRDSFEVNNINASKPFGDDTTVCLTGAGYILNAGMKNALSYKWQNNSTADSFLVKAAGQYRVDISFGNCVIKDTINISGYPVPLVEAADTTICAGESFYLPWGEAVTAAGKYSDTARYNGGCDSLVRVFNIAVKPKPDLGNDVSFCAIPGNYILNATTAGAISYNWQDGVTDPAHTINAPGLYWVQVNYGSCTAADSVTIEILSAPLTKTTDTALCEGTSFVLPWGLSVETPGSYADTTTSAAGCDSLILIYNVSISGKPSLGNDTTVSICTSNTVNLNNYFNITGLTGNWTFNNTAVQNPASINIQGNYRLVAANTFGCNDTAFVVLEIKNKPALGNDTAINICSGAILKLTSVYDNNGFPATWTLNGNTVSNPANVNTGGIYQLIAGSGLCSDTALVTLTITPKPTTGNDTTINSCSGNIVNLTVLYSTTGLTTAWSLNAVTVSNPAAVQAAGTYRLVTVSTGGCSDTAFVTIYLHPKPVLGEDSIINICTDKTTNLQTIYNIGGYTNEWITNGSIVSNPEAVNSAGVYRLISTNTAACADTAFVTLVLHDKPILQLNNPPAVCAPQTIDLTAATITQGSSAGLLFTYWTDAAGTTTYNNPAAAIGGNYFIKGTDAYGCFDIKPVLSTYYPAPLVNAGNDITICDKDSALLSANISNSNGTTIYEWTSTFPGTIRNPAAASIIVKPAQTQQYIVTVRDNSYGCSFIVNDTVLVTMRLPVAAFAGNDTIALKGQPHQLSATGGVSYMWSPPSLLNNGFIANPLAVLQEDSSMFTVIVKDIAGCTGYDTVWVRSFSGMTYHVPNAFSPNNDGRNDVFRPIPSGIVSTEMFRVINRYGEIVFETNQWMKGWDGTYKGKPQPLGNYVWQVRGRGMNGRIIEMKGNVVLIR
ncbi:MAG: gliding motility-associated C-terminal domain-containing protein [Ferruginibacter sp.]